jgi:hypothetical protein
MGDTQLGPAQQNNSDGIETNPGDSGLAATGAEEEPGRESDGGLLLRPVASGAAESEKSIRGVAGRKKRRQSLRVMFRQTSFKVSPRNTDAAQGLGRSIRNKIHYKMFRTKVVVKGAMEKIGRWFS